MTRRLIFCFMMIAAWTSGASAKGLSADSITPFRTQALTASTNSPLADTARAMIRSYDEKRGTLLPLPRSSEIDTKLVQDRIAALVDAHKYARTIVQGLSLAAAEDQADAFVDQLEAVIDHHDQIIFSALAELLKTQELAVDGWFVTSKFGAETERKAGQLLATASANRAFLFSLRVRLESLSAEGEASVESLHAAENALGPIPQRKTLSSGVAG